MGKLTVQPMTKELIEETATLVAQVFKDETFTSKMYDFTNSRTQSLYKEACILKARLYLEAGPNVFLAIKDGEVAGFAILKPLTKLPLGKTLGILFPKVFSVAPLLTKLNFRMMSKMNKAVNRSLDIPKPYLTLEVLGVHPKFQGQGIGKRS